MLPLGEVLVSIHHIQFWTILEAGWPPNLYSISKMLPIGEVLVQIGQPGAEILSSLHIVLLSLFPPYLRGCLSFGGYFFTGEEHFYRYIDMWLKIGQKGLFRGLASMEATQSQSTRKCKVCPKCSPLVKFWSQFMKRGQRYWAASILNHLRGCLASKPA